MFIIADRGIDARTRGLESIFPAPMMSGDKKYFGCRVEVFRPD